MKKKLLIGLVVLGIVAFIGYKIVYKDHRDISSEDATFTMSTPQLIQEFTANDTAANTKYADKTIAISGTVTSVDQAANSITIDEKLSAVMKEKETLPVVNASVNIKGRFVGYDDLLEELKMDQVSIIK